MLTSQPPSSSQSLHFPPMHKSVQVQFEGKIMQSVNPKIFITGVTGYVGGDALYLISTSHPHWKITCLVRDSKRADLVLKAYPNVRIVLGGLDDRDTIWDEVQRNDIVLHCADSSDNVPSANTISEAMKARQSPAYWIHTSGAGILTYPDMDDESHGEASAKIWDDLRDIDEVSAIPSHALHRNIDTVVLSTSEGSEHVKTAIVCPPVIYGNGRGPISGRGNHLGIMTKAFLKRRKGFTVGSGEAAWSNVHIQDLSAVYLGLVEAAAAGGGSASWNKSGYYFTSSDEHIWGELAAAISKAMHKLGHIDSETLETISADEVVAEIFPYGQVMWGTNARCRSPRTARDLGWKPRMPSVYDETIMRELIENEAATLKST